jgi:hypothetical protein
VYRSRCASIAEPTGIKNSALAEKVAGASLCKETLMIQHIEMRLKHLNQRQFFQKFLLLVLLLSIMEGQQQISHRRKYKAEQMSVNKQRSVLWWVRSFRRPKVQAVAGVQQSPSVLELIVLLCDVFQ